MKRVLVTGAAGEIGGIVRRDLGGEFDLTLLHRRAMAEPNSVVLEVAEDLPGLTHAMRGQDAVLHMALDKTDFRNACINEQMAKNVYEAALATQPHPRVIILSSIHAVGGYLDWTKPPLLHVAEGNFDALTHMPPPIRAEQRLYPNGLYGAAKAYSEVLGRFYADQGLQIVVLRIGGVREDDRLEPEPGYKCFFLSRRDCVELIRRAIDADLTRSFSAYFAVSNNTHRVHDISTTIQELGWKPRDNAEEL